ncbi:DASH complex subunit SPC19 [Sporobolomyces koalae]|uniref:DASH complex subunit SPC19 n=1 Tax=Sporobolomyces koalae TaxID=500713 RepID=UPI003175E41C
MSRLARPSMYPRPPPPSHWTALESCSIQLAHSCQHLQSSIQILHEATHDLPRLATVIDSTRVYDLIPGTEIDTAQELLRLEMSPQIDQLVSRAEVGLEVLKERERALRSRVEKRKLLINPDLPVRSGAEEEVELLERRLEDLRKRKEVLGKEVETLERQVEHRLANK